jgi:hypothetical protein
MKTSKFTEINHVAQPYKNGITMVLKAYIYIYDGAWGSVVVKVLRY